MSGTQLWSLLVVATCISGGTISAISRHWAKARVAKHMISAGIIPPEFTTAQQTTKATASDVR